MFAFDVAGGEPIFKPVTKRDLGVLQLMGESERGGQRRVLCEGVNTPRVAFEVITELNGHSRMAGRNLWLLCWLLAVDCVIGEFDDVESNGKPGKQVRELGEMFLHGVVRLVADLSLVLDEPALEDLLGFVVEGEEGNFVIFVQDSAELLEVFGVRELFEDGEEAVFGFGVLGRSVYS